MLHFAYGSNMDRASMRRRCPAAVALGPARLDHWRYAIMRAGYASALPAPGAALYGVLWRLTPRDLAAINAYECLDSGLYRRWMVRVSHDGRRVQALAYVAPERSEGIPKPGYQDLVVRAAREWNLPPDYIRTLERWLLVPRTRSSHTLAASPIANFGFKRGTRSHRVSSVPFDSEFRMRGCRK
jgi:hypothetical protein